MNELHPEHALLIAVADGRASSTERARAVDLINTDPEAADFYRSLQNTSLASDVLPDEYPVVPQKLVEQINAAQSKADNGDNPPERNSVTALRTDVNGANGASSAVIASLYSESESAIPKRFGKLAMAASLFCGMAGGAIIYGSVSGIKTSDDASGSNIQTGQLAVLETKAPEWVRLVVDYHRLYVRETVTAAPVASAETVSQRVSETLQTSISVPSLDSLGMQFRRAQWLAIDDQRLLQLAYLPDSGKPLAVCVLKATSAQDSPAQFGEMNGMQYVHWQSGEHAIVIVGAVSPGLLQDINQVVESELL